MEIALAVVISVALYEAGYGVPTWLVARSRGQDNTLIAFVPGGNLAVLLWMTDHSAWRLLLWLVPFGFPIVLFEHVGAWRTVAKVHQASAWWAVLCLVPFGPWGMVRLERGGPGEPIQHSPPTASSHLQWKRWGWPRLFTGIFIWIGLQAATTAALVGLIVATGHEFKLSDSGENVFDQANIVLQWSGERADAIARAQPLPDPPSIFADLTSIQFGFGTTLVFEVALIASVAILVKAEDLRALLKTFGMNRYSFGDLWVPGLAVIGMYGFTLGYTVVVKALGIDFLTPRSTVPVEIARDNLGLAMAGVLACLVAPVAEEMFFRGFLLSGLLKWGFLPAALISGALFTVAHLDIGSLIPFFTISLVMGWLYYWRGCLWDSIAFHFFFNTTSFLFLVSTR